MDNPILAIILPVLGIFAAMFVVWLVTGGPARYEDQQGKFIKPSAPLDTGKVYDEGLFQKDTYIDTNPINKINETTN